MWSCLLFLSLPVYSCKFLSQPLGSFVLAPSPLRNDRNIYRKSHAWIYSHHKSLPRKIVSFSVKTIRPQKNWRARGPYALPYQKSHFWYKEKWSPLGTKCPWPMSGLCQKKSCYSFCRSSPMKSDVQVQSHPKKSPSKTPTRTTTKNKCLKIGKTTLIFQFATTLFFQVGPGIFGEKKSLPTPMSHLSSPYAVLWVRMSGLGRPGRGEIHQDLVQFHSANLDDQPAWPKTFLSWDGVKKPGLLWWNWPFSKRAIWYVQPLLYNKGRVCLGSGGFIVLP